MTALVPAGDSLPQSMTAWRAWLARTDDVAQVSRAYDLAAAAETYAHSAEAQRFAGTAKVWAAWRGGSLLAQVPRDPGTRTDATSSGARTRYQDTLSDAGLPRATASEWQVVAVVDEPDLAAELEGWDEPTMAAAIRLGQAKRREGQHKDFDTPAAPEQTYRCVVADPPWPMAKIDRHERLGQTGFDYPVMTEDELAGPFLAGRSVEELAHAEGCHLYLWTTQKHLPSALRLAELWGFRYQCLLTWVKNVGFTPFSWMYSTEHVVFARRGNVDLLVKGRRLDFAAKTAGHSVKPDVFFDLVRDVSPGPRIELFARAPHDGFDAWGNEVRDAS